MKDSEMHSRSKQIMQVSAGLFLGIAMAAGFGAATTTAVGVDPLVGEIQLFSGNFVPRGWAWCDGQQMSVNQNEVLFSILGNKYGGEANRTFRLPNLQRAEALLQNDQGVGPRYIISVYGTFPSRQ